MATARRRLVDEKRLAQRGLAPATTLTKHTDEVQREPNGFVGGRISVHASWKAYGLTSIELRKGGNEGRKVIGERLPRNERNKLDVKRFSWYRERVARRDIAIVLPGGGLTVAFSRLLSALPFPFSGSGFSAPRVNTARKKENPKQIWQRDFPFFYAIFLSIRVLWFLRFFVDFILPSSLFLLPLWLLFCLR